MTNIKTLHILAGWLRGNHQCVILIIIIITLGQIILSYMANTSRTHARMHTHTRTHANTHARMHTHTLAHTHTRRRRLPGCRCSMGRCAPNHDGVNPPPLSTVPLAMNGRSVLHLYYNLPEVCPSGDVRRLQVAILARSHREMSQTDRIVWQYILSRVRISVRPSIFFIREKHP